MSWQMSNQLLPNKYMYFEEHGNCYCNGQNTSAMLNIIWRAAIYHYFPSCLSKNGNAEHTHN